MGGCGAVEGTGSGLTCECTEVSGGIPIVGLCVGVGGRCAPVIAFKL